MEIQPVYEAAKISELSRVAVTQAVVEARLLPTPGVAIARVLSISSRADVNSTEVFTGEARFTGKVSFSVLILDEEGHNHVIQATSDFSDKIESNKLSGGVVPVLSATVLDTDAVSLSKSEIKLASVVEITLKAAIEREVKYLSEGGEGVYTHDHRFALSLPVCRGKASATAENRLDKVTLTRVLLSEHTAFVTNARADRDCVSISGVAVSFICGETEDGLIASYRVETAFEEEIAATDARSGDAVTATACVFGETKMESDDDGRAIVISYDIQLGYTVYAESSFSAVTDVFSPTCELIAQKDEVSLRRVKNGVTHMDSVTGSVSLDMSMPVVDNILAATGLRLTVSSAVCEDGKALVEGVVSGNVIYYSAELDVKSSVAVEIPFALEVALDCESGDTVTACGAVTAVALKIRRGNEIDVKAEIALRLDAAGETEVELINALTVGKAIDAPSSAISIRIAQKGETLWQIAKALCCTPELVMLQNPELSFPLNGGERIMLYRHLERK